MMKLCSLLALVLICGLPGSLSASNPFQVPDMNVDITRIIENQLQWLERLVSKMPPLSEERQLLAVADSIELTATDSIEVTATRRFCTNENLQYLYFKYLDCVEKKGEDPSEENYFCDTISKSGCLSNMYTSFHFIGCAPSMMGDEDKWCSIDEHCDQFDEFSEHPKDVCHFGKCVSRCNEDSDCESYTCNPLDGKCEAVLDPFSMFMGSFAKLLGLQNFFCTCFVNEAPECCEASEKSFVDKCTYDEVGFYDPSDVCPNFKIMSNCVKDPIVNVEMMLKFREISVGPYHLKQIMDRALDRHEWECFNLTRWDRRSYEKARFVYPGDETAYLKFKAPSTCFLEMTQYFNSKEYQMTFEEDNIMAYHELSACHKMSRKSDARGSALCTKLNGDGDDDDDDDDDYYEEPSWDEDIYDSVDWFAGSLKMDDFCGLYSLNSAFDCKEGVYRQLKIEEVNSRMANYTYLEMSYAEDDGCHSQSESTRSIMESGVVYIKKQKNMVRVVNELTTIYGDNEFISEFERTCPCGERDGMKFEMDKKCKNRCEYMPDIGNSRFHLVSHTKGNAFGPHLVFSDSFRNKNNPKYDKEGVSAFFKRAECGKKPIDYLPIEAINAGYFSPTGAHAGIMFQLDLPSAFDTHCYWCMKESDMLGYCENGIFDPSEIPFESESNETHLIIDVEFSNLGHFLFRGMTTEGEYVYLDISDEVPYWTSEKDENTGKDLRADLRSADGLLGLAFIYRDDSILCFHEDFGFTLENIAFLEEDGESITQHCIFPLYEYDATRD